MAGLGIGLAVGLGPPSDGAGGGAANPNILLWTDELDQAVWVKTNCTVFPDVDGVADEFSSLAAGASVAETTTVAAATGAVATGTFSPSPTGYQHGEVSGTFDGVLYTLSCEAKDGGAAATPSLTLTIDRSGGFLRCTVSDPAGDGDYNIRHLQLEVGPFSSYQHRGGT